MMDADVVLDNAWHFACGRHTDQSGPLAAHVIDISSKQNAASIYIADPAGAIDVPICGQRRSMCEEGVDASLA